MPLVVEGECLVSVCGNTYHVHVARPALCVVWPPQSSVSFCSDPQRLQTGCKQAAHRLHIGCTRMPTNYNTPAYTSHTPLRHARTHTGERTRCCSGWRAEGSCEQPIAALHGTCSLAQELLDAFSLKPATRKHVSLKLSKLRPSTHILAHCGPTNSRLRAHLGVSVPAGGCASLRLAGVLN